MSYEQGEKTWPPGSRNAEEDAPDRPAITLRQMTTAVGVLSQLADLYEDDAETEMTVGLTSESAAIRAARLRGALDVLEGRI